MNKDNYHEQGNIIIMLLLLPLGHISNRNNRKRKGKEVLVVEQSGNVGGAKEAKAGDSGKEVSVEVAVADKQDGTNKQYCMIHRTNGHDLQNCRQVEMLAEKQKAEYERRDKEKG